MKFVFFWILLWKSSLSQKLYLTNLIKDLYEILPDRLISEHVLEFKMNLSIVVNSINFQNDKAVVTMKTIIKWPELKKTVITNKLMKTVGRFKLDRNIIWYPKIVYSNVLNHINLQNDFHLEIKHEKEIWFEYQDLSIYHIQCQRIAYFRLISHTECQMFTENKVSRKHIEWDKKLNCSSHQLVDSNIKIVLNTDNTLLIYFIRYFMDIPYFQFLIHSCLTIFGLFIALVSSPKCYPLQYIIITIIHIFLWISLNKKISHNEFSMVNLFIGICVFWSGILSLLMSYSSKLHLEFSNSLLLKNQQTQSICKGFTYVPGPFKDRKLKSIESKIYVIYMMKLSMVIIYAILIVAAVFFIVIDYSAYMGEKYGCI